MGHFLVSYGPSGIVRGSFLVFDDTILVMTISANLEDITLQRSTAAVIPVFITWRPIIINWVITVH